MTTVPFSNETVERLLTKTTPRVIIDYANSSMDPQTLMVYLSTLNVCAEFDIDSLTWSQWEGLMSAYLTTHHLVKSPTLEFHAAILIHHHLGNTFDNTLHDDYCSQHQELLKRAVVFLGSWSYHQSGQLEPAGTIDDATYVGINLAWLVKNAALVETCRNAVMVPVWFPQQFTGPFYNGKSLEAFCEDDSPDPPGVII